MNASRVVMATISAVGALAATMGATEAFAACPVTRQALKTQLPAALVPPGGLQNNM